jgi:hypothetical protein
MIRIIFLAFILLIVVSLFLQYRAKAALTEQQKILATSPRSRAIWPFIFLLLIGLIQSPIAHDLRRHSWLLPALATAILATFIAFKISDFRRLQRHHLPPAYIRSVRRTELITFCSLLLLFTGFYVLKMPAAQAPVLPKQPAAASIR